MQISGIGFTDSADEKRSRNIGSAGKETAMTSYFMRKWMLGAEAKEGSQRDHVGIDNHHTKAEWAAFNGALRKKSTAAQRAMRRSTARAAHHP